GRGEYPAYIACNLYCNDSEVYTGTYGAWMDGRFPKITQEGKDGDEEPGYIANMREGATAGYKYFDIQDVSNVSVKVRGYCHGHFEVKTAWDGEVLATIPVNFTNVWTDYAAPITIPNGVHALYFTYKGSGNASLASFT